MFDWENASLHVPHYDCAYFLLFSLPVSETHASHMTLWREHIEIYRNHLILALEDRNDVLRDYDMTHFMRVTDMMAVECVLNQTCFDSLLPSHIHLPCIPQVVENGLLYLESFAEEYPFFEK